MVDFTSTATTITTAANQTVLTTMASFATAESTANLVNWLPQELLIDEEEYLLQREYYDLAIQRGLKLAIRTAAQRAEHEAATRRAEEEAAQRRARRHEARGRARELLLSCLSDEQRRTFECFCWFIVKGGDTGTRYRIRANGSYQGNIEILRGNDGDEIEGCLCCHCSTQVPDYDHYVAQHLGLRFDENNFVKSANRMAG